MYKLCKTEQSASRQRQLEDGLLTAMKTKRYEEITISELCDQLQIPRKSFYRYFSSKDGALHALVDHTLLEFQRRISTSGGVQDDPHAALVEYFTFWMEQRPLLDAMEKSGLCDLLVRRAVVQAQMEYDDTIYRVPDSLRGVREQAISFSVCGLMSLVLSWHREGFRQTGREMAAIAATVLSTPLLAPLEHK